MRPAEPPLARCHRRSGGDLPYQKAGPWDDYATALTEQNRMLGELLQDADWSARRLHEATVHRADAAIALGIPYELPPELAADGIYEWLERLADEQALSQPPSPPGRA